MTRWLLCVCHCVIARFHLWNRGVQMRSIFTRTAQIYNVAHLASATASLRELATASLRDSTCGIVAIYNFELKKNTAMESLRRDFGLWICAKAGEFANANARHETLRVSRNDKVVSVSVCGIMDCFGRCPRNDEVGASLRVATLSLREFATASLREKL